MAVIESILRLTIGMGTLGAAAALQTVILLVLLPSRVARIRSCILFERIVGYSCSWLAGIRMTITGKEHLDGHRPAIYVLNHTSLVDLFIALRLMPGRAVGVAKKEVIYYPFFGQMYLLCGHLRVDRRQRETAIASMRALGELVTRARLSIIMSPEGTRSRDGRLLPFKKGLAHLALQTGLPIVPIVIHGAHRVWRKDSLRVTGAPVRVEVLPPVDTSHWTAEHTDAALAEIHAIFCRHLPADQQPAA
jgi:1-acyl-sn-glycerol-3-phosphate acyltransferase